MSYLTNDSTSYPSNLSFPFNSVSSITKSSEATIPPACSINLATPSTVPPVANKSSTTATL